MTEEEIEKMVMKSKAWNEEQAKRIGSHTMVETASLAEIASKTLTRRDWTAILVLAALVSHDGPFTEEHPRGTALRAVALADALEVALDEPPMPPIGGQKGEHGEGSQR